MLRLWLDTDVGDDPDDAIALLCAAGHPEVELVGVSTVDGDHERRVRIARSLVDAPVHAGDEPMLADIVRAAAPDALLAIGPLSNVAAFLATGPLPPITLMGGAIAPVRHWGTTVDVEHNFGRDPQAAASVVEGAAPRIVPLDVTVTTGLDPETLERLVAAAPALRQPTDHWLALQHDLGVPAQERAVFLHDPLAFLALVEPSVVHAEQRMVRVAGDGQVLTETGSSCEVVIDADVPRAVELVLSSVELAGR